MKLKVKDNYESIEDKESEIFDKIIGEIQNIKEYDDDIITFEFEIKNIQRQSSCYCTEVEEE